MPILEGRLQNGCVIAMYECWSKCFLYCFVISSDHPKFRHTLGENYRRQNSYNSPKSMYAMQNKVIQYCIVKERKTDISYGGRVRDGWMCCTSCFQSILLHLVFSYHYHIIQCTPHLYNIVSSNHTTTIVVFSILGK